jgi:hypothetical protein
MNENKTIHQRLCEIQKKLKVGKEHNNSFGKYKYRKAEDILKEIKEYLIDDEYITTSAQIQSIQERFYVVITACFHKSLETVCAAGYARESFDKKGMDDAQLTGATTSYAKKYALCNLFAIDDEADNDDEDVQKKARQMEFEKEKTKLLQTKDITQLKTIFTTIYNNKSLFTPEQFIELETIKNNKKEDFEN